MPALGTTEDRGLSALDLGEQAGEGPAEFASAWKNAPA
jgi:hypothetical protein